MDWIAKRRRHQRLLGLMIGGLVLLLLSTHALTINAVMAHNIGARYLVTSPSSDNLKSAETWLKRAVSLRQETATYRLLGKVQQLRGDIVGAIQEWRDTGVAVFAVAVGLQELAQADPKEASIWEQGILPLISQRSEWQRLGAAYEERGEYTKAVDAYQQGLLLSTSNEADKSQSVSEIYYSLARIYKGHFGDSSRAVEAYSKAVEADDFQNLWHRVLSHQELAILLIGEDSERAVVEARRAVELMPESSMGHSLLGLALYSAYGDLQQAEREIRVAIDLDLQSVWPWMHLGQLYFQAEEYKLAMEAYLEAAKLNPQLKDAIDMAAFIRKTYLDE